MPLHFFSIPALRPEPAQAELNAFLAAHRVVGLDGFPWTAVQATHCRHHTANREAPGVWVAHAGGHARESSPGGRLFPYDHAL